MKLTERGIETVLCALDSHGRGIYKFNETRIRKHEFYQSDFQDCVVLSVEEAKCAFEAIHLASMDVRRDGGETYEKYVNLCAALYKRIREAEYGDGYRNGDHDHVVK